ncbi:MAG: hypothetical protein AB7O26_15285, partial [Planctomycetaceae bacterium]
PTAIPGHTSFCPGHTISIARIPKLVSSDASGLEFPDRLGTATGANREFFNAPAQRARWKY